jgi:hypothetical protein
MVNGVLTAETRKDVARESKRNRQREKELEREREHENEREKVPVNAGHRAAGKGRSLDLGLGLSWAPTKVREDALMASFGQGVSSGKRLRPREGGGKFALDVTEVFRSVLSEEGFAAFKKCTFIGG